ncbi:MAG TPA: hypothetical protein PKA05_17480, partial [Roseiflexaceae bacterium]|nr:hypothetical protein [Roseiflexaceae bacterium]
RTHSLTTTGTTLTWQVDPAAGATCMPWASRDPAALAADLHGMAEFFPSWILTAGHAGRPIHCSVCRLPIVPHNGALRCPACHTERVADPLLWIGQLPAIARPEAPFARARNALRAAGFAEVHTNGIDYLLVPFCISYPSEWPNTEPTVRYATRWLTALGMPHYSAAHHLIGAGTACLYAWGQWRATTIDSVVQQRLVNHLASLLKIAAGIPPQAAFIGRDHHQPWSPQ